MLHFGHHYTLQASSKKSMQVFMLGKIMIAILFKHSFGNVSL